MLLKYCFIGFNLVIFYWLNTLLYLIGYNYHVIELLILLVDIYSLKF